MKRKNAKLVKSLSLCIAILAMFLMLFGCSGSDGAAGAAGAKGDTGATGTVNPSDVTDAVDSAVALASIEPEQCEVCHKEAGSDHQSMYNKYNDAPAFAVTIDDVTSVANGAAYDVTMKFTITDGGSPYTAGIAALKQKTFYTVQYDSATRTFINSKSFSSSTATATGTPGQYTVKATGVAFQPENPASNALVYMYIAEDELVFESLGKGHYHLYDNMVNVGKIYGGTASTYVSAANVANCEKCHGHPYGKHGYRMAEVSGLPDFAACKTCHYDTRNGGHQFWQILVDNPARAAELGAEGTPTAAEKVQYAYKASVMNDTHMSHAMEFAYPQSMANCVTCHEGKLTTMVLTDANFVAATCKSCHPVTGPADGTDPKRAPALITIWAEKNVSWHDIGMTCNSVTCHATGGNGKAFSAIHTGYDSKIYAKANVKYSSIFKIEINSATLTGTDLKIKFTATKTDPTSATTLAVTSITPKVMIGLHAYDTKDYIVDAHGSNFDDNGDGVIKTRNCGTACDYRNLEYDWGSANPRFTGATAANGVWEVTAKLANWSSLITDKTIKRIEIGVLPALKNANGDNVPIDTSTKTFDIATKAFVNYFTTIAKNDGCNNCHGALGVTFHSAQYGNAGVVGCRFCHTTRPGGSHLEMQSRSIDSYVHAIHAMAPFDIGDIAFTDPVEEMHYEHHIESTYPNFTLKNCESCHNAGTYEVPDQTKSLGGTLSASDTLKGKTRNIGSVPSYVTGPGSRACGSCHRQMMINEDAASELASFNQHVKKFGYLTDTLTFDAVTAKVMSFFK